MHAPTRESNPGPMVYKTSALISTMGERWGLVVVTAASLNMLICNGFFQTIGLYVVEWQQEFQVSAEMVGWIGSFLLIGYAVAGLAIAMFGSRFSCRCITIFGASLACISLALSTYATQTWHMFIAMLFAGCGLGHVQTANIAVIGFYIKKHLGMANGFVTAGSSFGLLVLPPLLSFLIKTYHWRGAMLITSGIVANIGVMGSLYRKTVRETEANKGNKMQEYLRKNSRNSCEIKREVDGIIVSSHMQMDFKRKGSFHQVKQTVRHSNIIFLLCNYRFLLFLISLFLRGFSHFASLVHFVAMCVTNGVSKEDATFLLSLMGIFGAVARLTHGIFVDKGFITPLHLLSLMLITGGASCIFIAVYTSFVTLVIFATIFGTASSVYHAIVPVAVRRILHANQVKGGLALCLATACSGGLLGVPLIGKLVDVTHSYSASCYSAGGFLIASGLLHFLDPLLVKYQRVHDISDQETEV